MENISTKFKNLFEVISSKRFLNKEGLGGEIPFYISDYHPTQELEIRTALIGLKKKLSNAGIPNIELNLYDIICEILESKGGMERMFRIEVKRPKAKFLKAMQSTLNIHQILIPTIQEKINNSQAQVYFLTGIGLVFPYIRSHFILSNLQNIAKEAPTVIFFPGTYSGKSLTLFNKIKDDNYYRAFEIDKIRV